MPRFLRAHAATCAALGLLTLLITGCPNIVPGTGGDSGPAKLVPFQSAQDLLSYFKQQANARVNRGAERGLGGGGWEAFGGAAPTAAGDQAGTEDAIDTADTGDFSTTNVQEVGVDESDVFKSDGTYFYIAKENSLRIVQADPPEEMAEVGRIDLDMRVDELYLAGSSVIALGTEYGGYGLQRPEIMIWPPYYRASTGMICQVDVSDPTDPTLTGQIELDGSLVSSRLINGRLITILTIVPELPPNPNPISIGLMELDAVMPKMRRSGGEEEVVPWQRWLHPVSPDGCFMTAVVTLDASDIETVIESVAILANAGTIYASTEALYVTDAEYDPQDNFREKTAIHKFDFNDDGAAQYVASGSVPGRLLNQFSLGEYEGYLRVASHVATTGWFGDFGLGVDDVGVAVADTAKPVNEQADTGDVLPPPNFDPDPPYNAVYVLGQTGGDLTVTGFVDGIAPDEQIYAARFMGTRGFLVTFRRIDPLWVLDLSDPENPQVMGELEIPGYSEYLHPLGDSHLIGVGRSVEVIEPWDFEEPAAVQLSLFDVSDWTDPQPVQQITIGGAHSYSEISQTHKAFTLIERDGQTLLALPVRLTPDDTSWIEWVDPEFFGVVCFEVDPATGFTELGRVAAVEGQYDWWTSWCRAAFIENALYAITPAGVRASTLPDFAVTHEVELAQE